ncbi:MAG: hypothetical protein LBE47_03495 [Methanomassiliicoccaceae archaeon]|jgi:membrane protein YqaA with SNARE-associated domain|nr:hypothetical protein [Methanomassiliicoccaceae archaeon]
MFDIGGWLGGIFGPYGEWGVLLIIFLIFFIDAIFFPTLPELFFVIGFMAFPTLMFGSALLLVAVIAEVLGISLLYYVVEKVRVPKKIKNLADRYVKFLAVSDERIFLVNRVAPIVPFAGAFISLVDSWRYGRSMIYVVIGCVLKYGAIMLLSNFFFEYFSSNDAQTYMIVFIFAVIAISMALATIRKRRSGIDENC